MTDEVTCCNTYIARGRCNSIVKPVNDTRTGASSIAPMAQDCTSLEEQKMISGFNNFTGTLEVSSSTASRILRTKIQHSERDKHSDNRQKITPARQGKYVTSDPTTFVGIVSC